MISVSNFSAFVIANGSFEILGAVAFGLPSWAFKISTWARSLAISFLFFFFAILL